MSLLSEIQQRFRPVLSRYDAETDQLLKLIKPSQDERFGDYQLNCAMPLGKKLKRPPREIAEEILAGVDLEGFCEKAEIAGPGFINLTLHPDLLKAHIRSALASERVGVATVESPETIVIDYSSPNVAKPMHVGHIRSTVIGDSLARILRFLGHRVITDNHLGDWGTQFGMIIYGFKHFVDKAAFDKTPVEELSRLYRYVRRIMDHLEKVAAKPGIEQQAAELESRIAELESQRSENSQEVKKAEKILKSLRKKLDESRETLAGLEAYFQQVAGETEFLADVERHSGIGNAVLAETAKLHAGDEENKQLWQKFMPYCKDEIRRVYSRLKIEFDYEYGESFYHSMLPEVVEDLKARGMAQESEGAQCVFLEGFEAPMIVQKKDGAYLYSTTDLATIRFRMETWNPDRILYVVDHRQSDHFEKLFAAARLWGYDQPQYFHVAFGTIMGPDGKPYKTRSGDTVGLEGLLDEAVENGLQVVEQVNNKRPPEERLSDSECRDVAETVGIGGLKYFDLSQHRASDYVFTYDKMLALKGDTAPYVQYSFARVQGIFRKCNYDPDNSKFDAGSIVLDHPAERALALKLLRFEEALLEVPVEYKPNLLTSYLFELAQQFAVFFERCPVLKAENESLRQSRLLLCNLTGQVIRLGLGLLGIEVREKM